MNDYDVNCLPDEYVEEQMKLKELAISQGLYDEETKALSTDDECSLYQAMSTLSDLMKKTDSSLSELLRRNGYGDINWNKNKIVKGED